MRYASYDGAQERFIIANAEEFTAKELSAALGIKIGSIYKIGHLNNLTFKKAGFSPRKPKEKKENPIFNRPAPVYNQIPSPYGIASEMRHL